MTKHTPSQPIGIFDSGIGGLTIAHAVAKQLPHENIVYFGDTAHLPYGDKSAAAIQAYSVKIAHMLLQQKCKLILIACSSASAAAYELVKEYVGTKASVMNVIDPVIHLLKEHHTHQRIGLIGTRQTVNSNVYKKKIDKANHGIQLISHPTNLLASAIEEFGDSKVIDSLLAEYLSFSGFNNIDALVLACTHYPLIKKNIDTYFSHKITIIDPSEVVATAVKQHLEKDDLLNQSTKTNSRHFYVSDYTESFAWNAKKFFGEDIEIEHYPLWE